MTKSLNKNLIFLSLFVILELLVITAFKGIITNLSTILFSGIVLSFGICIATFSFATIKECAKFTERK